MEYPSKPPFPSEINAQTQQEINSQPEIAVDFADKRSEFEQISRQVPRDEKAERAFIESKIEIIRSDPRLSDADKEQAIAELRKKL